MPGAYALSGLNVRSFVDGYGLLQSFTTGDTAQALQTGIVSLATLEALTGVMRLDGADGARLVFARTSGATALAIIVTGFEPIMNAAGTAPSFYVERVLTPVLPGTIVTGVVAVGTQLDTTNIGLAATVAPTLAIVPSTALWVSSTSIVASTQPCVGYFSASSNGGTFHIDIGGVNGSLVATGAPCTAGSFTHIRVLLTCTHAADSLFCLAKRLKGRAELYR